MTYLMPNRPAPSWSIYESGEVISLTPSLLCSSWLLSEGARFAEPFCIPWKLLPPIPAGRIALAPAEARRLATKHSFIANKSRTLAFMLGHLA